jgi:hypothetical protein
MKVEGLISLNLTEASKLEVFYQLLLDKFNFHKDYIIKRNKIYQIKEHNGDFHDIYIRNANILDYHIYEVIQKIK